jgi:hypothetical protein
MVASNNNLQVLQVQPIGLYRNGVAADDLKLHFSTCSHCAMSVRYDVIDNKVTTSSTVAS